MSHYLPYLLRPSEKHKITHAACILDRKPIRDLPLPDVCACCHCGEVECPTSIEQARKDLVEAFQIRDAMPSQFSWIRLF